MIRAAARSTLCGGTSTCAGRVGKRLIRPRTLLSTTSSYGSTSSDIDNNNRNASNGTTCHFTHRRNLSLASTAADTSTNTSAIPTSTNAELSTGLSIGPIPLRQTERALRYLNPHPTSPVSQSVSNVNSNISSHPEKNERTEKAEALVRLMRTLQLSEVAASAAESEPEPESDQRQYSAEQKQRPSSADRMMGPVDQPIESQDLREDTSVGRVVGSNADNETAANGNVPVNSKVDARSIAAEIPSTVDDSRHNPIVDHTPNDEWFADQHYSTSSLTDANLTNLADESESCDLRLIQTQNRKQALRQSIARASQTQDTLFAMTRQGRPLSYGTVPRIISMYRSLLEAERDVQRNVQLLVDEGVATESDKKLKFEMKFGLYKKLILALPRRDLEHRMEILRRFVKVVDEKNRENGHGKGTEEDETEMKDGNEVANNEHTERASRYEIPVETYFAVCDSIGAFASILRTSHQVNRNINRQLLNSLVYLGDLLIELSPAYQHRCLPRLMTSALSIAADSASWDYAADIFWYMDEHQFSIPYPVYHHVIKQCTFRNTPHFPFWKVLKLLEYEDHSRCRLDMQRVLEVLNNYYPFADVVGTKSVMRTMLSLQQTVLMERDDSDGDQNEDISNDGGNGTEEMSKLNHGDDSTIEDSRSTNAVNNKDAAIPSARADISEDRTRRVASALSLPLHLDSHADRGTLQAIAAAGARAADPDMVLMAWDLCDQAGYAPTVDMYENVIKAFAAAGMQDHSAFSVLAEMEAAGIGPSRSLIWFFARQIRRSPGRLNNAFYILSNRTEGTSMTTASLNVIVAACAGCGDADGAFDTYGEFEKHQIAPDANTFSYILESMATDMSAEWAGKNNRPRELIDQYATAAHDIMEKAKARGVASAEVLHQYVRVLCSAGQLEECLEALESAIAKDERVLMESFSMVAIRHANAGLNDTANRIAKRLYKDGGYGYMPRSVIGRIKNIGKQPKEGFGDSRHELHKDV